MIIVITGPTAVGKTKLSVELAKKVIAIEDILNDKNINDNVSPVRSEYIIYNTIEAVLDIFLIKKLNIKATTSSNIIIGAIPILNILVNNTVLVDK